MLRCTLLKLIHTSLFPPRCPSCGQAFAQKSSLVRHAKLHEGRKDHKCPFCPFSAAFKTNLKLHVLRLHWDQLGVKKLGALTQNTPENPSNVKVEEDERSSELKCPHCSCIFQRMSCLSAHVKRAHKDEVEKAKAAAASAVEVQKVPTSNYRCEDGKNVGE